MLKLWIFAVFLGAPLAFAQTYPRMDFSLQNAQGQAIAGATINVYNQTACGGSATTLATLYATALGPAATPPANVPLAQPLLTDGFGHAFAYLAANCYTNVFSSPYTGTQAYQDQTPFGGGGVANISNQANGVIPLATAPTVIGAQSHLDDGVTTSNVITSTRAFVAPKIGSFLYASQLGTSPTAINTCALGATGQTCIADPSYPGTEQKSFASMITSVPSPFHFEDDRNGLRTNFHHSWGYANQNFGTAAAIMDGCLNDGFIATPPSSSQNHDCHDIYYNDSSPGFNFGNQPVGHQGWYSIAVQRMLENFQNQGIHETVSINQTSYGIGDNATQYNFATGFGGFVAASDEGQKPFAVNNIQGAYAPTLICSTGCTAGSTQIKGTNGNGNETIWGTGRFVIDSTQSPITNTITSFANSTVGTGSTVTLGTSITASVAYGTLSGNCVPTFNTVPPFSSSVTCAITTVGGTVDTSHLICFKSQQHDCAFPTAASPTSITLPLRKSHANGTYFFQGGSQGGMEATFYTTPSGSGVINPIRYLFDVIGCVTTTTCEVQEWQPAGPLPLPLGSYIGWSNSAGTISPGSANISTLSNSGTTVSATYVSAGSTLTLPNITGSTITISGASDTAFNTACSNIAFSTSTAFTCTITGLSGSHTATTAAAAFGKTAINAVNLWPMAEVLDVQNESLTPPSSDGTFMIEPNVIQFTPGDTMEETQHVSMKMTEISAGQVAYNPFMLYTGIAQTSQGAGVQGGSGSTSSNSQLTIGSANADSIYQGLGTLPPNMINMTNGYYIGINTNEGPYTGQNFINIQPTTGTLGQRSDPNYKFNIFNVLDLSGASFLQVTPNSGNTAFSTTGAANWTASSHTFTGAVGLPASSTAITASPGDSSTKIATTAFVATSFAPLASPAFTGTPTGPNIPIVTALTTTGATTDNVTVTGMTSSGHCQLTATNASAATNITSTYVSAKTTNQITVTHTATASMTYDVLCTSN